MAFKDRAEIETLLRATADEALEFPVASLDEPMVFSSIVEELNCALQSKQHSKYRFQTKRCNNSLL